MKPGDAIGDYVIVSRIGEGGMSVAYLAEHVTEGTRVVIKRLKDQHAFDQQVVRRFRRGATILRDLRHPHLARVFGVIERGGQQYVIQEYLAGGSLAGRPVSSSKYPRS